MRKLCMILALAAASAFSGSAQDATALKTPYIVARLSLTNQTQYVGSLTHPVPFFTTSHKGMYRVSVYVQLTGNPAGQCDGPPCAMGIVVAVPGLQCTGALEGYGGVSVFSAAPGQSVGYFTQDSYGGTTVGAPFNLDIVIEEL